MAKEITITTKDGEMHELDPVLTLTIFNGFAEYDFNGDDIVAIEIKDMKEEE